MDFENLIGAGQQQGQDQKPLPMDDPSTDIQRAPAHDMMAEAMLASLFKAIDKRKQVDPFYINSDNNPEAGMGQAPNDPFMYGGGEGDDPSDDDMMPDDGQQTGSQGQSDQDVGDAFGRYDAGATPFDEQGPPPQQGGQQAAPGDENPFGGDDQAMPQTSSLDQPSADSIQKGGSQLSSTGYSEPNTDPYNEQMREALRKIVRAV